MSTSFGGIRYVRKLDRELAKRCFDYAAEVRDLELWDSCSPAAMSFALGAGAALGARGEAAVVQIRGSSGVELGLRIHKNFDLFRRGSQAKGMAMSEREREQLCPVGTLELLFCDPADPDLAVADLAAELAFARRVGGRVSDKPDPQKRHLPLFHDACRPSRPLTAEDVRLFEAALALTVRFYAERVVARPVPPPPWAQCYDYEPLEVDVEVHGAVHRPRYPAGPFPREERIAFSMPGAVSRYAARPAAVRTVGQAAAFHREALARMPPLICARVEVHGLQARPELNGATGRVVDYVTDKERYAVRLETGPGAGTVLSLRADNLQRVALELTPERPPGRPAHECALRGPWRSHTFGLCNALWELETEADVREAIALSTALLDEDPEDADNVEAFLMDILLEAGDWVGALALLHRYKDHPPGPGKTSWAWTNAHVALRVHGPRSDRAKRAVAAAIDACPHAYPLLTKEKPFSADAHRAPQAAHAMVFMRGMSPFGDEVTAQGYAWNAKRLWWGGDGSAITALVEAGAEAYAAWHSRHGAATSGTGVPGPRAAPGAVPVPAMDRVVCRGCGTASLDLKLCQRCRKAAYCSPACQRADWKQRHKHECEPAPSRRGA
mmetsp:Transcript_21808/g.73391  ORF Transcript_21808/g.73391 Transcript_21808/m.73391 type:complete len:613 (-) Transcript_21808:143-1981(-)|eukprot:CAMPEP_0206016798 /NCGR_PEP_ID=MMETSP1464-20131121/23570_1 /ASSEMBLY_ACC=CAM_ASM_001124 /TAXON_ID=119497 /ORGANISM="Exanthemachrysis gayraliae, Strain RCC1523" /LENGTH=612 /DNA_ID=CAMNT_0053390623 /DNA_START=28 /DNA_END=1866 /DNA_ORIENTATION=-